MALKKYLAYTLIEVLVTVAVIGGVTSGAYMVVTNTTAASARAKLDQDVAAVNRAIQVYGAHGGRIPRGQTGDTILARLRREAANPRLPGLKGSLIDPRMTIRWQKASESVNRMPRAYWDDSAKEFYIASSGSSPGVKEFFSGDLPVPLPMGVDENGHALDPNKDDRTGTKEFASVDSWVWDYDGTAQADRIPPNAVPTAYIDPQLSEATVSGNAVPLQPPLFSIPAGTYPLSTYPKNLNLVLPSTIPVGAAEIYYYQTGGSWRGYSGAIPLNDPGVTVAAKSVSLDPDHFEDSAAVDATYETTKITLALATTLRSSYRYAELGGALAPGSPAPVLAPTPTISLSNADALPDQWENSGVFQTYWTWDGSDPTFASAGRVSGIGNFSNPYPGENLPLLLSDFGSSPSQTLRFVALTKKPTAVNSSAVGSATVIQNITSLLPPIITPGNGSLESGDAIVMVLNTTGAQTPAGARIYYRTDGVDPGNNNGEPATAASLYTGEFHLAPDSSPMIQVVARVYPPTAYKSWFSTSSTSTMTYYLPYANSNLYGVQGSDKSIYLINPSTGVNSLLDDRAPYNLRSLALDVARSRLYYIEESGSTTGWRLGYLDFLTRNHGQMGNLKTGWTYNATAQPQNLAFFNGSLYYIHKATDDLVRISFNTANTAISSVVKVADMRSNSATFTDVGDIAIDDSGLMFFCTAGKNYWRFDLMTMSGIVQLGTCARTFEGMAFFQERLFGTDNNTTKVWRLTPNTGKDLSSLSFSPARDFVDLAAPCASVPVAPSNSMWAIVEQTDGPHLVEFRNYRSPLISTSVDYGAILYETNKSFSSTSGSGIGSLAITSDGVAYFARNLPLNGPTRVRPLFKLNIGSLNLGDIPIATFVGDLGPGLASIAGTLDPDDYVTGLSLSPSGQLYGVLREGLTSGPFGADYLFKCTQVATAMTGPDLSITSVGRLTSSSASSTNSEDLVFSRSGELYVSDTFDGEILRVNPANGSILSIVSTETSSEYRGLAVDNSDFQIVASNVSGPMPNTFLKVDGGQSNDDTYLDYNARWGYQAIRAISFFQAPFLLVNGQLQLFACDGTPTIYGVDFATGQTVRVTDALYPVRALAYDLNRRLVYYLESTASNFRLGSFSVDTFVHFDYGTIQRSDLAYFPSTVPDNLMYYSGCLWYVEPKTDNLVKIQFTDDSLFSQAKASNMTGNAMTFDLIGDLAVNDDGWMYFSSTRTDGQRFSRFKIKTMSTYETISGPIPPPVLLAEGGSYRENWFDALAFGPPDATGARILYGTYSSAPAPMRKVTLTSGDSVGYKLTTPAVNIIDFSDQHPGDLNFAVTLTPQLAFKNVYPGYRYADVGGPFLRGAVPPPAPAPVPLIDLVNPTHFTTAQLSSTFFQVKWTYDSSDPRTSGTALTCAPFTNGFPGQLVDIGFGHWGTAASIPLRAAAKSLQPTVVVDSSMIAATATSLRTELRMPVLFERLPINSVRQLQIVPNIAAGDCPPGCRIYYTTNGADPGVVTGPGGLENPVTGILYTGIIQVPFGIDLMVTARVYPPVNLPQWFAASPSNFIELHASLDEGDMDVMTADQAYPFRSGHDTGHSHQYEKVYGVSGINFFNVLDGRLHNIQQDILPGTKFKLVVANANLSPAGRFVINKTYNAANSTTWTDVTSYDNTVPGSLPIYTLDGVPGTTRLTQAGIYFDLSSAKIGGLLRTEPGHVLQNNPGYYGEWRNGALCIQAVKVNADGTPAFVTNPSFSGGGVQGPGTSGVLWEIDVNWHGPGGPYGGSPGAESYDADGNWIGPTP